MFIPLHSPFPYSILSNIKTHLGEDSSPLLQLHWTGDDVSNVNMLPPLPPGPYPPPPRGLHGDRCGVNRGKGDGCGVK